MCDGERKVVRKGNRPRLLKFNIKQNAFLLNNERKKERKKKNWAK